MVKKNGVKVVEQNTIYWLVGPTAIKSYYITPL